MKDLINLIEKFKINNEIDTSVLPELSFYCYQQPVAQQVQITEPFCSVILQGQKRILLDGQEFHTQAGDLNLSVVDMPMQASIINVNQDKPYYCLVLKLALNEIAQMISEYHLVTTSKAKFVPFVSTQITPALTNAFYRLLTLLTTPQAIPILAPLIKREIYYWLLQLPESHILYQALQQGSHQSQIHKATQFLRQHYQQSLSIRELADYVQMSQSNFYLHFRKLTGISPLQFQKQLRLQQARQLILTGQEVSTAAFDVGYESLSQFSREYRRYFGQVPSKERSLV